MTGSRMVALADDATGALEAGCQLTAAGVPSEVWLETPPANRSLSLVIDTQSRHCPPAEARDRVRGSLANAGHAGWIFKKTDSTLRGNIAAEIAGALEATGRSTALYVPAYPALGRTVHNGRLYLDGVSLEQTAFARDPLHPVTSGSVQALFEDSDLEAICVRHPRELSLFPTEGKRRVLICDGESDADVRAAAAVAADFRLDLVAAGPASFAGALATRIGAATVETPRPRARRGLIVCGSQHPASLSQVTHAAALGIPLAASATQAVAAFQTNNWVVLKPDAPPGADPCRTAAMLAAETAQVCGHSAPEALILFGGETTFTILRKLNARYLLPQREILAGVSVSRIADRPGLCILAKAGGFGPATVIPDLIQQLGNQAR